MKTSYDSACHDLACHFLADEPTSTDKDRDELAQVIQTAIEDWLGFDFERRHAGGEAP